MSGLSDMSSSGMELLEESMTQVDNESNQTPNRDRRWVLRSDTQNLSPPTPPGAVNHLPSQSESLPGPSGMSLTLVSSPAAGPTPRASPQATRRATPRSTRRATPQATRRTTPRATPQSTPRQATPRGERNDPAGSMTTVRGRGRGRGGRGHLRANRTDMLQGPQPQLPQSPTRTQTEQPTLHVSPAFFSYTKLISIVCTQKNTPLQLHTIFKS